MSVIFRSGDLQGAFQHASFANAISYKLLVCMKFSQVFLHSCPENVLAESLNYERVTDTCRNDLKTKQVICISLKTGLDGIF